MGTYHYIDFQCQVSGKNQQRRPKVHVGRESHTTYDEKLRHTVHIVVYIKAIQGTRLIAEARQRAVKRIAKPVQHHTKGAEPQPLMRIVRKQVSGSNQHRSKKAEPCQHVRCNP